MLKLIDQFRISEDVSLLDELIAKYQSELLDLDSIYMQNNDDASPQKSSSSSDF